MHPIQTAGPAESNGASAVRLVDHPLGKPWENHGKTMGKWCFFMGFYGILWEIYPLVMIDIAVENHHLEWENSL